MNLRGFFKSQQAQLRLLLVLFVAHGEMAFLFIHLVPMFVQFFPISTLHKASSKQHLTPSLFYSTHLDKTE